MARSFSCYGWNCSVSEVWRVLIGAYVIAGLAQLVPAADNPEPALLEFLGATSRLEAAGLAQWQSLNAIGIIRIIERFERWNTLSESDRAELNRQFTTYQNLDNGRRRELRELYQRYRKLTPTRQEELRDRYESERDNSATTGVDNSQGRSTNDKTVGSSREGESYADGDWSVGSDRSVRDRSGDRGNDGSGSSNGGGGSRR